MKRRSARLAEKNDKTFNMPTRDKIWEKIPSTSKTNVRVRMPPKQSARNFTRESHYYNQDRINAFGDEITPSQESFIVDNESPSTHDSMSSQESDSTKNEDSYDNSGSSGSQSSESNALNENDDEENGHLSAEDARISQKTPSPRPSQPISSQESDNLNIIPRKTASKKRRRLYSDDEEEEASVNPKSVKRRLFRRIKMPDEDEESQVQENSKIEAPNVDENEWYGDSDDDEETWKKCVSDDEEDVVQRSGRVRAAMLRKKEQYNEKFTTLKEERMHKKAKALAQIEQLQNGHKNDDGMKIEEFSSSDDEADDGNDQKTTYYTKPSRYYLKLNIIFKKFCGKDKPQIGDPEFVKVSGRFYDKPRFAASETEIFDNNDIDFDKF